MLSVLAAIVMQAATPAAPSAPPLPRPSVITHPDWLHLPTGDDMAKFYPKAAADAHIEGRAVLRCTVTVDGDLADCTATGEDPPGNGFDQAVLNLAPLFKMKPMAKDGVPVSGGKVAIPIRFVLPPPVATTPSKGPELATTGPKAIKWIDTPGPDIFAITATHYVKGRSGSATLFCIVGADGRFVGCRIESESAPNMGYGYAAMAMAQYYRMAPTTTDGTSVAGGTIRFPISFIAN